MWKLYRCGLSVLFSVLFVLYFITGARAAVIIPQFDIHTLGGDEGISSVSGTLDMGATAIAIITHGAPIDITDVEFSLMAQYDSFDSGNTYYFDDGSLSVGSLLTADFSSLMLRDLGSGMGQFEADLSYTGGSLAGGLSSGRIEGIFYNAVPTDYSSDFTATQLTAKVGPIVPIPSVVWLLSSGLVVFAKFRKKFRK
jgi:hypothetical protein